MEQSRYVIMGELWQDGGTGDRMLRYAITNLSALPSDPGSTLEGTRRSHWLRSLQRWTGDGVDFVQLREKSLDAGEILQLAREGMDLLLASSAVDLDKRPRILINSRSDIAAAARVDGVHLTSRPGELTVAQVRAVFQSAGLSECLISHSCHSIPEVTAAVQHGADLALFGPVFGKVVSGTVVGRATGLPELQAACRVAPSLPVLALGGVTRSTTAECLQAGAAGVAGIRLFDS